MITKIVSSLVLHICIVIYGTTVGIPFSLKWLYYAHFQMRVFICGLQWSTSGCLGLK